MEIEKNITADSTAKLCPQCDQWNLINWWWHSDHLNRWVCYGCGMGRSKEYHKDQEGMKKYYETKSTTQTSTR